MRTRPVLLAALAAAALVACGDDGSPPAIDARLPDAQTDAASCVPVDDSNECTTDECVNDLPVNTPRTGASCAAGGTCSSAGVCVPAASCTDNMMNGTETGVDCGGSCAPASTCGTGIGCAIAADCTSGVCSGTPMTCQAARCGDGTMQAGEMCDDGNDTNGDGCDDGAGDACRATGCGNGVVTGTEVCDDGNAMNGDGCDNNCTATACGNGVTAGAETCDQGNTTAGDGCSATCTVETGYTCTVVVPSVCSTTCGDGVIAGAETCDQGNGNTTAGDGCSATCTIETGYACTGTPSVCGPVCGNGVMTAPETCDDSNTVNLDGCSSICRTERTELEPNEDGTPSTSTASTTGNDFDTATAPAVSVAATNADAQGPALASVGSVNLRGALRVGAAPGTAGDEDAWAIRNDTASAIVVRLDVWSTVLGFGVACPDGSGVDTALNIRSAQGARLASNDDRVGAPDRCSAISFVLPAATTVYAHLVDFGDNEVVEGYALQVTFTPIVCGDNSQVPGFEECDDGNTTAGDGCSATCVVEGTNETEPNEDGMPATGGTGIAGNDFDSAGGMAVANATAQGVLSLTGAGGRTWIGSLSVGPAPGTAGDEDVYAVTNAGTAAVDIQADTYDAAAGINRACANIDTGINVRDAAGVVVTSNDDNPTGGACSRVTFLLLPGQTRYLHVTEYADNSTVAKYFLAVVSRAIVCGDSTLTPLAEECDDGNTTAGDGCSATCVVEGTAETEPNEDGAPATGGTGIAGNDFDSAGGIAVANATAQGVLSLTGTNGRTWIGALRVGPAPGTAGDEDVYAVTNPGTATIEVQADTYDAATGLNQTCVTASADTGINVRDAAGALVTSNDTSPAGGSCSRVTFGLPPGATRYIHVTEAGDNSVIAKYFLVVASRPAVCGNGVRLAGGESCDDGNTTPGDGCSATCTPESGYTCNATSPTVCTLNRFAPVPLACTDMTSGTTSLLASGQDDTVATTTALPFPVVTYGTTHTHFAASTNGFVALLTSATATRPAASSANATTVPSSSTPNDVVAPFWDDLVLSAGGLVTKTTGASPNQVFTIEWNASIYQVAGTTMRFQAQFVEGGSVQFHYCSAVGDAARTTGSGATIGTENATGTVGSIVGIDTANAITSGTTALSWNIP